LAGLSLFVCDRQHEPKPVGAIVDALGHDRNITFAILKPVQKNDRIRPSMHEFVTMILGGQRVTLRVTLRRLQNQYHVSSRGSAIYLTLEGGHGKNRPASRKHHHPPNGNGRARALR
jgi:hypothetical protein